MRERPWRYALGGLIIAVGVATILYGGYLAAFYTSGLDQPYRFQGYALCLAGITVIGVGAWLCGVDVWHGD